MLQHLAIGSDEQKLNRSSRGKRDGQKRILRGWVRIYLSDSRQGRYIGLQSQLAKREREASGTTIIMHHKQVSFTAMEWGRGFRFGYR